MSLPAHFEKSSVQTCSLAGERPAVVKLVWRKAMEP
jgi:hypothetical protein